MGLLKVKDVLHQNAAQINQFSPAQVHNKLGNTHLALMHFSWAMDLDPKGANSQIKDALDPALNRAGQEVETTVTGGGQAGEETAEMVEIEAR